METKTTRETLYWTIIQNDLCLDLIGRELLKRPRMQDMNLTLNVYICDFVFFLTLRGIAMLTYDDRINELSMSKLRWRTSEKVTPEV